MIKINIRFIDTNLSELVTLDGLKCEDYSSPVDITFREANDEEMKNYFINQVQNKNIVEVTNIHGEKEYICTNQIKSFRFE